MKMLRLQLEDLRIDSFATMPVEKKEGTVFGEQCTCYTNCTCPGCPTCDASCNGTCDVSCGGGCGFTAGFTCVTCRGSCGGGETCDYTCSGFATYGAYNQPCVRC